MKQLPLLLFALTLFSCTSKQEVDILIYAKAIYLANDSFSTVSAIAIKDGKILETGNRAELENKYTAKEAIDEPGKYIYPGFIDAHCHFSGYALSNYKCDLVGTSSFNEIISKLIQYEKTNKIAWIYGRGWDQNDWAVKEFPSKDTLDKLFPDKPVMLKRIDGHAILCNQKALDMAGITPKTKIAGGMIIQDKGKLTGVLVDNAMEPVEALITMLPKDQAVTYLKQAEKECYSLGLTGVVDCGVTGEVIELLKTLYADNTLAISNTLQLSSDKKTLDAYVKAGPQLYGQLQLTGIKLYADGALGSRGACLLHDYADMPGHRGMLLATAETMSQVAKDALQYNWQLCTHAIGDSANRTILKLYAENLKQTNDKRWRIEHAQVVDPADYIYFPEYSIIPSVQPTHATSDMPWAGDRLGKERLPYAYSYKNLLQQAGWVALGTDFPVEAINPLATFYAAIARKDKDGNPEDGFLMANALSREEALKGMTTWAAKSVFLEKQKGSLEAGKDADLIILDKDIMTAAENEILGAKVIYTFIKGKTVYKK